MKYARYPKYKPSGVEWLEEVPTHWDVRSVKRLFRVANGSTPQSSEPEYWDGDIVWVTPDDLGDSSTRTVTKSRRSITPAGYASCGTTLVPASSLVLSTRAPIGHIAIAGTALCTNQGCRSLVPFSGVDSTFYYYALCAAKAVLTARGNGTTFLELSKQSLETVPLPTPEPSEQRAIAAFLDRETARIDALIAKEQRLIELLAEKRTALISHAVTKGLNADAPMKDSGVEWLGEISAHWEPSKLRNFVTFITSGSRGWAEHYADSGAIFVRIGNLTRDSIRVDLSDVQYVDPPIGSEGERTAIRTGDLLFSITAYLGSIAVAPAELDGAYVNQHIALVRLNKNALIPEFAAYVALSHVGQTQLKVSAYGGTKVQLSLDDVKGLRIAVPALQEQKTLVDVLDNDIAELDSLVAKIKVAIERLQEYRMALISDAVTGKIDVRTFAETREVA